MWLVLNVSETLTFSGGTKSDVKSNQYLVWINNKQFYCNSSKYLIPVCY